MLAYTQVNSKVGNLTRRRPDFKPGLAGAEAAKLKKFSDAGGLKIGGCPTQSKTNF